MNDRSVSAEAPRRNFILELWSCLLGGIAALFPFLTGVAVFLDPLRRGAKAGQARFLRVATLDAVPDDGLPRQFPVIRDATDAWNYSPNERVGAVYLRRMPGESQVKAFNVVCPHAGCFVGFDAQGRLFQCPCHTSSFTLDGEVIRPSPSPRGMDPLEVRVTDEGAIEVAFVNYYPGKEARIEKN
jgi:menaquinol-cytochrome c reductase iron-sulfur subunit